MSLVVDMEQEVSLLSSVEAVKNARNNLQNYTHFNHNTFRYNPTDVEKAIEEQFRLLKISHNAINFVFLGTADGGYMEYPRFQAVQAYEPRLRPWYTSTLNKEDIVISEPYPTKVTNEMVVGFTKQVRDDRGSVVESSASQSNFST
jgi:methyl-accepting chemotaxis protein